MSHERYEVKMIIPKFETFFTYGAVVAITTAALMCMLVLTVTYELPIPILNVSIGLFLAGIEVALCHLMEARAIARDTARDEAWSELIAARDEAWRKLAHKIRDDIKHSARENRVGQLMQSFAEEEIQNLRSIKGK